MKSLKVLLSWHTTPSYIMPPVLTPDQTTLATEVAQEPLSAGLAGVTPIGVYDMYDVLKRQGIDTKFDMVVVSCDSSRSNRPYNLDKIAPVVVLLVGDSHHQQQPIGNLLHYCLATKPNLIISLYNRQHLRWLHEAGLHDVAWLPGLGVPSLSVPFSEERQPHLLFIGNVGKHHPRRKYLLDAVAAAKLPLAVKQVPPMPSIAEIASAQVSFNCSLNGDLNLRIFEILRAGGVLLTDKLSVESGLDHLLTEGEHYIAYSDKEECLEKIRWLLASPRDCLRIARAGHEAYAERLDSLHRLNDFAALVSGRPIDSMFLCPDVPADPATLGLRLAMYEHLQELQRLNERATVVVDDQISWFRSEQFADLIRLDIRKVRMGRKPPKLDRVRLLVTRQGGQPPEWAQGIPKVQVPAAI